MHPTLKFGKASKVQTSGQTIILQGSPDRIEKAQVVIKIMIERMIRGMRTRNLKVRAGINIKGNLQLGTNNKIGVQHFRSIRTNRFLNYMSICIETLFQLRIFLGMIFVG